MTQDVPGVGEPDGFERLWTPHRLAYVTGAAKPAPGVCPFCLIRDTPDDAADGTPDSLVVRRGRGTYVVLNLYPYNPGHLLVVPDRHVADLTELTAAESAEITALSQEAMRVLRATSGAGGFNLGLNQGAVAGAGIAAHLHVHVVPRYPGDANFLPIVARTKALPDLLGHTRDVLRAAWAAHAAPVTGAGED